MASFRWMKMQWFPWAVFFWLLISACSPTTSPSIPTVGSAAELPSPYPTATSQPPLPEPSQTSDLSETGTFQPNHSTWINRYPGDLPAYGHYVLPASDGSTLILAWREGDPWVIKITADGSVVWQQLLDVFALHSMVETFDGDFVFFGPYDILRMTPDGEVVWQRSFSREIEQISRIGVSISFVTHIETDLDSGGWEIGDEFGLLSLIDPDGMLAQQTFYWGRSYYPDSHTHMSPTGIATAAQTGRSGFIIEHYGLMDNNHWRRQVAFKISDLPTYTPYFLIGGDNQGGLLFGGPVYSYLIDGGVDLYLLKLDRYGSIEWQRVIEGTTSLEFVEAFRLRDGGFLLTATRWGFYAIQDEYRPYLWMIRLDAEGDLLWQRIIGDGEHTMQIRHLAEKPDGTMVLVGQISSDESLTVNESTDLLVLQLDASGQIPGCTWAITVNLDIETPHPSISLDALEAISHEEARFEWLEEDHAPPQATSATIEQLCVDNAGYVPPTPTLDPFTSAPTQVNTTYVFLNAEGYVFGGVQGNRWIDWESASSALSPGQPVMLYADSEFYGQAMVTSLSEPGLFLCDPANQFDLSPPAPSVESLAITGTWSAAPRQPSDIDHTTAPYPEILEEVLNQLGLSDPFIQISTLQRIDLEGDGAEEVVMTAFRQRAGLNSTAISPGDYSVVLLRRLTADGVVNILLVSDVYQQAASNVSPIRYRVLGMIDLNADGVLEIIIEGSSRTELIILVYDLVTQPDEPVLSFSCLTS